MALAYLGNAWTSNSKTAGAGVTLGSGAFSAGELVVVTVAMDNVQTTDGPSSLCTAVRFGTSTGALLTKIGEFTNGQGAAAGGATVAVWVGIAPATWGALYFAFASSITAKAVTVERFSRDATKSIAAWPTVGTRADDAADAGSIALSGLAASTEYLAVRGIAGETSTTTAPTVTSGWTAGGRSNTTGGSTNTNMGVRVEFRIQTATSFTSDPVSGMGAVDHASILVALSEITLVSLLESMQADGATMILRGNESSGSTLADSSSGGTHSGTKQSGVTLGATAIVDSDTAPDFTAAAPSYVDVPDHADFAVRSDFTIAFVMQRDTISTDQTVIHAGPWKVHLTTGDYVTFSTPDGSNDWCYGPTAGDTNRHLYVLVHNGDGTADAVYLDGVNVTEGTGSVTLSDTSDPFRIGADQAGGNRVDGRVAYVAYFPSAISSSRIATWWASIDVAPPVGGTTQNGAAVLAAAASVAAAGGLILAGSATLAAAATVAPSGLAIRQAAAALSAAATVSASAGLLLSGSATLAGAASIAPAATLRVGGAAVLTGSGSAAPSALVIRGGSATLAGAAAVSSVGGLLVSGASALSAAATLAAQAGLTVSAQASLGGTAALAGTASLVGGSGATLTAAATLSAVPLLTAGGTAVLAGAAAVAATGRVFRGASATLAAAATISPAAGVVLQGGASLVGTAAVSAVPVLRLGGSAVLVGTGALTGSVSGLVGGTALLAGAAGLVGIPTVRLATGSGLLAGSAVFVADGTIVRGAAAALAAQATLTPSGLLVVAGAALLAAQASAQGTGSLTLSAAASLLAEATFVGTPATHRKQATSAILARLRDLLALPDLVVETADSEPFFFVPGRLYVWEETDSRTRIGELPTRQDFGARAVVLVDDPGDTRRSDARGVTLALDAKRTALVNAIRAAQSTDEWDHAQAEVDHDYVRAFGVRGLALRITGYRVI